MLKSFIFMISLTTITSLVEAKSSTDASTKNISFTPPNVEIISNKIDMNDLKKCAETQPKCASALGLFYLYGKGVEQNYQTAFEYFSFAAKHDVGSAYFHLGIMHKNGVITGKNDLIQAFEAFASGASLGDLPSQIFLASAYETGEGVEINYEKALKWHLAASAQGDDTEQRKVCDYYQNGWGTEIDYEKSFEYCKRALLNGNALAAQMLANHFYRGLGVKKDILQAYSLLIVSKELGNSAVDKYLPHVQSLLSDEEILKSKNEIEIWHKEITNNKSKNDSDKEHPKTIN
ncbi:sel1 repeat family protein [Shewanella glacialipiscicola]|uniref:tetratricopeptide repeat protein n=1 Tax=Shewanella glacialipiscicola TaxID=614069 RepID=UPI0021DB3292|nr:tetratricopeptide repeat protein [Shewanella glacialipiscicola]MCU7996522.1 sel1 repeat family protein [Shewanella glacialipiscicola]MCU8027835.1 sel1 repeat family protein [Shewanella glacialipiscicola]